MAITRELNGKEVKLEETAREVFDNVVFSAGLVCDHPDEEIYLRVNRKGKNEYISYMQRCEALAIIWILARAVMLLDGHEIKPEEQE
jgi:hypothetical protein